MLWIRLRVSPCNDRATRSSLERVTTIALTSVSCLTVISGRKLDSSLPLGPSTRTVLPSTVTLTLAGTGTGCFPIRDITKLRTHPPLRVGMDALPHGAEDFAADPLAAGLAIAHQAAAGTQNGDAQSVEHRPQVLVSRVSAAAGFADPLDVADHPLAVGAVL